MSVMKKNHVPILFLFSLTRFFVVHMNASKTVHWDAGKRKLLDWNRLKHGEAVTVDMYSLCVSHTQVVHFDGTAIPVRVDHPFGMSCCDENCTVRLIDSFREGHDS